MTETGVFTCFECGREFPIEGPLYLGRFTRRVCKDCRDAYINGTLPPTPVHSASSKENKLISLSA